MIYIPIRKWSNLKIVSSSNRKNPLNPWYSPNSIRFEFLMMFRAFLTGWPLRSSIDLLKFCSSFKSLDGFSMGFSFYCSEMTDVLSSLARCKFFQAAPNVLSVTSSTFALKIFFKPFTGVKLLLIGICSGSPAANGFYLF